MSESTSKIIEKIILQWSFEHLLFNKISSSKKSVWIISGKSTITDLTDLAEYVITILTEETH